MKKLSLFIICMMSLLYVEVTAQGYKIGEHTADFRLPNVDGNMVSMKDYPDAKGFILVFTCNHCPFSKIYESRIMDLDKKYRDKGYPLLLLSMPTIQKHTLKILLRICKS